MRRVRKLSTTKPETVVGVHPLGVEWTQDGSAVNLYIHSADVKILMKLTENVSFAVNAVDPLGVHMFKQEMVVDNENLVMGTRLFGLEDGKEVVVEIEVVVTDDEELHDEKVVVFRTMEAKVPCRPLQPFVSPLSSDDVQVYYRNAAQEGHFPMEDTGARYQLRMSLLVPSKTTKVGSNNTTDYKYHVFELEESISITISRHEVERIICIQDVSLCFIQFQVQYGRLSNQKYLKETDAEKEQKTYTVKPVFLWSPWSLPCNFVFAPPAHVKVSNSNQVKVMWNSMLRERAIGLRAALPSVRYHLQVKRKAMKSAEKEKYFNVTANMRKLKETVLDNLIPGVEYLMRCELSYRVSSSLRSRKRMLRSNGEPVLVETKPMVPSCPPNLSISHYIVSDSLGQQLFLQIEWDKSDGNGMEVLHYLVETMRPVESLQSVSDERWEVVHKGKVTQCVLSTTLPRGNYVRLIHVRVRAENKVGLSPANQTELVFDLSSIKRKPKRREVFFEAPVPRLSSWQIGETDNQPTTGLHVSVSPTMQGTKKMGTKATMKTTAYPGSPQFDRASGSTSPLLVQNQLLQIPASMKGPSKKKKRNKNTRKQARKLDSRLQNWKAMYSLEAHTPPHSEKQPPKAQVSRATRAKGGEGFRVPKRPGRSRHLTAGKHHRGRHVVLPKKSIAEPLPANGTSRLFMKRLSLSDYSAEIDRLYREKLKPTKAKAKSKPSPSALSGQHAKLHVMELRVEARAAQDARAAAIRLEDELADQQALAAVKLQSEWRGARTRRDLEEMRRKLELGRMQLECEKLHSSSPALPRPSLQHAAAQRIQSRVRGCLARGLLAQQETEASLIEHLELQVDAGRLTRERQVRDVEARKAFRDKVRSMQEIAESGGADLLLDGVPLVPEPERPPEEESAMVASALSADDDVAPLPSAEVLSHAGRSQASALYQQSMSSVPQVEPELARSEGSRWGRSGSSAENDVGNARLVRDFPDEEEGWGIGESLAATHIQTRYRAHRVRLEHLKKVRSATYIQARVRSFQQRSVFLERSSKHRACATILQTRFRGHQIRSHFDHLRRKLATEVNAVTVRECGHPAANGAYEMAGLENDALRYMRFGVGAHEHSTFVIERMKDKPPDSAAAGKSRFLWTLYEIDQGGAMKLLYGNRAEGGSLRVPRRRWQVIIGSAPVPKLFWDASVGPGAGHHDQTRAMMNQHKEACMVMESGNEEIHGKYISSGVSDSVRQFKMRNEKGEYSLRRVQYDGMKLWVLVGVVKLSDGCEHEKAFFVNSLPTDFPPEGGWGLAQDGVPPLPLIVHQKSLQAHQDERRVTWTPERMVSH